MEPLEATLMDELLRDFSGDMLPPTPPSQRRLGGAGAAAPPSCSSEERRRGSAAAPIMHPSLLDGPAASSALEPFPAFVEEDLEWLSNKDAFPTLETFDISASRKPSPPPPPPPPPANPKRPSPVSVLDGPRPPPALQWAPGRARSKGRRRRRPLQVFRPPEVAALPPREKRRCWHCDAEETPQWRAGPNGPKTLCNACGVRYKSGRLLPEYRPANSPTFSSSLHSNSHRKVMEMRRKKEGGLVPAEASPPATMTKKKGLLAL